MRPKKSHSCCSSVEIVHADIVKMMIFYIEIVSHIVAHILCYFHGVC